MTLCLGNTLIYVLGTYRPSANRRLRVSERSSAPEVPSRSSLRNRSLPPALRTENDLENRMDCYEAFCDFEVEETGERGTGTAEYSVLPPWPQWKA